MKILIGADLVPTESNLELFSVGAAQKLVGNQLLELLQSADCRIFNLEVPLTDVESPIDKCGPALIAPTAAVAGYTALGVDCLSLANNHIMDQGWQGLSSTIQLLNQNHISVVGGGKNRAEASKPHIFHIEGKRIGIYACAEHEFSIAEENYPGANPFDPLESPDHVSNLKNMCDYVIVLYHGGKEHYRYPSPNLQKVCRKLVEKGADLVVCQHSHCVGCEEKYMHGTIVYGQGNFLFDHHNNEFWMTGLLIQIGDDFEISYIPLAKVSNCVRLADNPEILNQFYARNAEICEDGFIEKQYSHFAESMLQNYLHSLSGRRSFVFRVVNKLSGHKLGPVWMQWKYSKKNLLAVRNLIECEAHRELILRGLSKNE